MPGVIGQSVHSPCGAVGAGEGVASGLVGCGVGAGSGGAVEHAASASNVKGKSRGAELILIAKEYGQKRTARLVLISDDPT